MSLELHGIHLILRVVSGILVQIREKNGLRIRRLNMLPRASITMTAGANLIVEGAIDLGLS